ncbi:MAG: hypothetical protein GC147_08435 [Porphyrobacter sp.]|nr:hypothetical protein [Porphyrobacter sp.]
MNTRASLAAALGVATLMLAACGSSDDASTEASADTVEMPADEALEGLSDEPVADPEATATEAPETAATPAEVNAEKAADAAADVAAEAAAAAQAPSE